MQYTIRALWDRSAEKYQYLPALSYVDEPELRYGQIDRIVKGLQSEFTRSGVKAGGKIAIISENMPNWGIAYLGVATGHWTVVPILPDFSSEEISNILLHSESSMAFVSRRLWPKVAKFAATAEGKKIQFRLLENFGPISPNWDGKTVEGYPVPDGDIYATDAPAEGDLAAIIYTSGTTGQSKGVMLSHQNISYNATAGAEIPQLEGTGHRMLSILPLSHSYECSLGFLLPLVNGYTVYYISRPPSPTVLLPALKKVKPTLMLSVPLLIEKIYRSSVLKKFEDSKLLSALYKFPPTRLLLNRAAGRKLLKTFGGELKFFGIGGAKIAEDVEKFLKQAKFPYAVGYGLTETSPLIAGTNAQHQVFRSTGPVLPGTEVRFDSSDEQTVPGELQVKGPGVMLGYYKDDKKTAEVFTEDGWFRTGDTAVRDAKGNISIMGRIKTMILGPSGENIYPEVIEALINEFSLVEESLVLEDDGKIIARIHLNTEAMAEQLGKMSESLGKAAQNVQEGIGKAAHDVAEGASQLSQDAAEYLKQVREAVNKKLANFSKISQVFEEKNPFIKTPTKKIKRYLYKGNEPAVQSEEDADSEEASAQDNTEGTSMASRQNSLERQDQQDRQ